MSGETQTTEQSILDGIDAAEEGMTNVPYGSEPTEQQVAEIEGTGDAPAAPTTGEQRPQSDDAAQQTDRKGGETQQQQPTSDPKDQQQQQRAYDKDGNVIDAKTGEIIASHGRERRVLKNLTEENTKLTEMARKQATTIDQLNAQLRAPREMGLNDTEIADAHKIMAQFKTDPVGTARYVLSQAMQLGHNLDAIIGKDAAAGVSTLDMQAINRMIESKLAPVNQMNEQQQKEQHEQAFQAEVQKQYDTFLASHDHADIHEQAIANLMGSNPAYTPEAAYWQLRTWAKENGYDFAKPLSPQIDARNTQSNGQPAAQTANQQPRTAPMPMGGSTTSPAMVSTTTHQTDASMDPDASFDDIVMQSMREANMIT